MLYKSILAASAFVALASAQATPASLSLSPAEATKAVHDIQAYITSIEAQPAATSAVRAVLDAAPSGAFDEYADFATFVTATAAPSWWSNVPDNAQAYFTSVARAEESIIEKAARGPAPTHAPKVAGAVLVAGGAALAFL